MVSVTDPLSMGSHLRVVVMTTTGTMTAISVMTQKMTQNTTNTIPNMAKAAFAPYKWIGCAVCVYGGAEECEEGE